MVSIFRQLVITLFGPLYFLYSLVYYKQRFTPVKNPKTRFKSAYQHLHNQLTELLIENVPLVSMDIGGTLTKVLVFVPTSQNLIVKPYYLKYFYSDQSFELQQLKCKFLFFRFETAKFSKVIQFLIDHKLPLNENKVVRCTGGGAYKYRDYMIHEMEQANQKIRIEIHDEMLSLQQGLVFSTALNIKNSIYSVSKVPCKNAQDIFENIDLNQIKIQDVPNKLLSSYNLLNKFRLIKQPIRSNTVFPCLLVHIGTGVSFVKCESDTFCRVDGSALGGGTFYNMQYLVTQEANFDFVLLMASQGQSARVNLLLQDIQKASAMEGAQVVSSFGKYLQNIDSVNKCDKVRALLYLVASNLAHLAVLNCRLHGMRRVVFSGGFCGNDLVKDFLVSTVQLLSGKDKLQVLFLAYESVLGTVGSMIGNEIFYQEVEDRVGIQIQDLITQLQDAMLESETTELGREFVFNGEDDSSSDEEGQE